MANYLHDNKMSNDRGNFVHIKFVNAVNDLRNFSFSCSLAREMKREKINKSLSTDALFHSVHTFRNKLLIMITCTLDLPYLRLQLLFSFAPSSQFLGFLPFYLHIKVSELRRGTGARRLLEIKITHF